MQRTGREHTCCFTGHRPEKLPWGMRDWDPRCADAKRRLRLEVERAYAAGYRHFMSGMARGGDWYFARIVLDLRREGWDVTLEAAIPCADQAKKWPLDVQKEYNALVRQCDVKTVLQERYDEGCMLRRNRYMVDNSGHIIALYDGRSGGTGYTLRIAKEQGLTVAVVPPTAQW